MPTWLLNLMGFCQHVQMIQTQKCSICVCVCVCVCVCLCKCVRAEICCSMTTFVWSRNNSTLGSVKFFFILTLLRCHQLVYWLLWKFTYMAVSICFGDKYDHNWIKMEFVKIYIATTEPLTLINHKVPKT